MTKKELFDEIKLDFANVYNIPVDELGDNFVADSAVLATSVYNLFLRIQQISQNVWVGSADAETLLIIGQDKLGRLPFPAVNGIYDCTFTQIGSQTAVIPAGTQFKRGEYVYESLADVTPGTDTIIQVRALTAGTKSALVVSNELVSLTPLSSINDTIVVATIVQAATDTEDIEDYRALLVNSFVLQPSGGNASDYIVWAADVAGISTVYPYAADGEAGKINVYCEGVAPNFQPNPAKIDEVIDAIRYDQQGNGRVAVDLYPFITDTYIVPVQITDINIILDEGNASQQSEAELVIENYLLDIRPYLPTLNQVRDPEKDTVSQSGLIQALSDAGITLSALTLKVKPLGGSEVTVTSYQVGDANDPAYYGEIPVLESLTINT